MQTDTIIVFTIIICTLILFASGRLRFDLVAISALLAGVFTGVVPAVDAFSGFGHPAVITVAAVLIISKALQISGVVGFLASLLAPARKSELKQVAAGSGMVAVLSCFMNNVGALALMLPVVLQNASKAGHSPSRLLMPLSFASLLGGLVTLIGTPTNFVVSTYRMQFTGEPYSMFDFAPVGAVVALVGLAYLALIGWRLLPERVRAERGGKIFHVEDYITEVNVPKDSSIIGQSVRQLERAQENELTVMAIIRKDRRRLAPRGIEKIREGDTLILEGDPSILNPLISTGKLHRDEGVHPSELAWGTEDVNIMEMVLLPNSPIEGQSMRGLRMHDRYGINLLALSRRGEKPKTRLANTTFRTGDILLLQGEADALDQAGNSLGLPGLVERDLGMTGRTGMLLPVLVFAVAIFLAAAGLLAVPIAFVSAVVVLVACRAIGPREIYSSIDWPIIIMLGSLIPIGDALQDSGGTALIANFMIEASSDMPIWVIVAGLLVVSMWVVGRHTQYADCGLDGAAGSNCSCKAWCVC